MSLKYRELKRRYELDGAEKTVTHLTEALQEGHLKANDFSIRDLAEALVPDGREWVRTLDPRSASSVSVLESGDGVDVTAFQNIAGQVIYSKVMEAYNQEAFVVSKLVDTVPTRLDGEKIPIITRVGGDIDGIGAGMPYPHLGFGEDYVETPSTTKRGFIVPVTKEVIFFDRTNLILSRASEVGEIMGLDKEKRILGAVVGADLIYKWKELYYSTYQTSGSWVNSLSSNELVDWTNVDAAEQLFAEMVDPNTGEPILVTGTTVLVSPAYRHAAHRVFNAAELTFTETGSQTASVAPNPLSNYRVYDSRLLLPQIVATGQTTSAAKKWWFVGDFKRTFAYMENWPITVTQAPVGSEADFNNDIVLRFKASERGSIAVVNPRYMVRSTG